MVQYPTSTVQYPDIMHSICSAGKKTLHGYLQRPPTDTVQATQQKGEKFVIKEHGPVGDAIEFRTFD